MQFLDIFIALFLIPPTTSVIYFKVRASAYRDFHWTFSMQPILQRKVILCKNIFVVFLTNDLIVLTNANIRKTPSGSMDHLN